MLALDRGAPIRRGPSPYKCIGGNLLGKEEIALVKEVIGSQTLFRHYGPKPPHMVDDLEQEFCRFIGTRYALATSTGSGAYFCAAAALEIREGDEVIIPAYGWITDYNAVAFTGATPVFADIDESLNISPEAFERKITPRTKAVIVIHYQGGASRLDKIVEIARKRGVKVVEDVAQSCGGSFGGRKLGTWGDIACFSLQAHKMITTGDGGFLTTDSQEVYEKAVRFHDLGLLRERFVRNLESPVKTGPLCGMQWRMSELGGAVGLAQLRKLPRMVETVHANFLRVRDELGKRFPKIRFRRVRTEDDIGITLAIDVESEPNVKYFQKAWEAEGLAYGSTSYCQTMGDIEVVRALLQDAGRYDPADFDVTREIEQRFAMVAMLPVHTRRDVEEISRGMIKVLGAMEKKKMIWTGGEQE
jgi:8-amino-3,8-dideoxy-alpha-D-manno-octulosonate transaminase